MSFPVAEKFVSINGESICAGEPAVFVRFRGCNLNCSYCDTKWANEPDCPADEMSARQIADYVKSTGITNVTLTGGEPLLQPEIAALTDLLISQGNRVEIETNGSVSIGPLSERELRPVFTLDYKLPGSGMESSMVRENYEFLRECDAVKFVSGSAVDLETAADIIDSFRLTERCRVYISPVFGKIDPKDIVSFMLERKMNGVRLQLQLHKFIWEPERKGV